MSRASRRKKTTSSKPSPAPAPANNAGPNLPATLPEGKNDNPPNSTQTAKAENVRKSTLPTWALELGVSATLVFAWQLALCSQAWSVMDASKPALISQEFLTASSTYVIPALAVLLVGLAILPASAQHSPAMGQPIITLSLWMAGRLSPWKTLGWIIAQLVGAVLGSALARGLFPQPVLFTCLGGAPTWNDFLSMWQAGLAEGLGSLFLLIAVFSAGRISRDASSSLTHWRNPLQAGSALALSASLWHLIAGPLTTGRANPAWAFGPALTSGFLASQPLYWIAPILPVLLVGFYFRVSRDSTSLSD